MVNIEIHGFGFFGSAAGSGLTVSPQAFEIRNLITMAVTMAVRGMGRDKEVITTICPCIAASCEEGRNGTLKRMPYIRVCSDNSEEIVRITKVLKSLSLHLDTEELRLEGVTEAKDMVVVPF